MNYLFAYDAIGNLIMYLEVDDVSVQIQPPGGGFIATTQNNDPITFMGLNYSLNGVLMSKTTLPASPNKTTFTADGVDEVIISGIPNGAIASVTGVVSAGPETITDGEIVITSNTTGSVNVVIKGLTQYLLWSCTLNAI